jgi:hypothetical protein
VLKKAFTSAPILMHADSSKPFFLETNASDFALNSVFSQYGEDTIFLLIAPESSVLQISSMKIMTKSFWLLLMLLKNGAIYLKRIYLIKYG